MNFATLAGIGSVTQSVVQSDVNAVTAQNVPLLLFAAADNVYSVILPSMNNEMFITFDDTAPAGQGFRIPANSPPIEIGSGIPGVVFSSPMFISQTVSMEFSFRYILNKKP